MSYPLQQLRDIHLGAPPAEGWFSGYGSLLLGLLLGCLLGLLLFRLWPLGRAYWQLRQLPQHPDRFMEQLNLWLKRTALQLWSRSEVASLHGRAWLSFLDRASPCQFSQYAAQWDAWSYGARPLTPHERDALLRECRRWLRGHLRRTLCFR